MEKIMKQLQNVVLVVLILLSGSSYSMQVEQSVNASVEMYFLPDEGEAVARISSLIDSTNQQILVSMYWVSTESSLLNKIIALAQRGVDVQIIVDESMDKFYNINKLLKNYRKTIYH